MKILFLGKHFPPDTGGIEKYTYDLAKKMKEKDHDVWVLVANKSKKLIYEKIDEIKVVRLPTIFYFLKGFLTSPIFYWLKKIDPDIIHLQVPNPWFEFNTLIYCIFADKKKLIVTYHSDIMNYTILYSIFNFFRKFIIIPLMKIYACKIIATSPDYVKSSKFLWCSRNKVEIIPSSLDLDLFPLSRFKNRKIKKIYFVGRLVNYKGIEYLIDAINLLSIKRRDFRLIIIGDGPLRKKLQKMVENMFLEDFIEFRGNLDNKMLLKQMEKDCDIFVLPSIYRSEALGLSVIEAMALGKPVITTKIDGSGINFVNKII